MIKNPTGIRGELYTVRRLRDSGAEILDVNFNCRFGEIDIVADMGDCIAFVEVKTRNKSTDIAPAEAVDFNKTERIRKTAEVFINAYHMNKQSRFDVSEVWVDDNGNLADIKITENAFT